MDINAVPAVFQKLQSGECISVTDLNCTQDGFFVVYKSLAEILARKGIFDFPDSEGERLLCSKFYDDWFLYAVPDGFDYIYSLLKFREQEHDAEDGLPADGDTPGVTISFISFACEILFNCLKNPTDENRIRLDNEINRVVAYRGQRHHESLKRYFVNSKSAGAYLAADLYMKHIASFAVDGRLDVPEQYKVTVQKHRSYKNFSKWARLPRFIEALNQEAGCLVCDHEKIYIKNPEKPTAHESMAILATHTANTSVYSFAAEVEYHARFLMPLAKIKIPFFGRSVYDSAIRADMTVGDTEFEGPAPFYKDDSKIVKRQHELHCNDIPFFVWENKDKRVQFKEVKK